MRPMSRSLEKLLARNFDDEMLREIANADYGESVDEHLSAIETARSGSFTVPLEWEPLEVLELVRWSEPADKLENGVLIRKSVREHWMRLICCTVLLKTSSKPENHEKILSEDSTIIQFVRSAIALGDKTILAAIEFIEWLTDKSHLDCPFCPVALVILELSLKNRDLLWTNVLITDGTDAGLLRNLVSECQLSNAWKTMIQKTLIESDNVEVKQFGQSMIAV